MGTTLDDLVVVVPGIQGSQLWRGNSPVWSLGAKGIWNAIASLGSTISSLQLPPDIGDDDAPDGIVAHGLMGDLHGLPGFGPIIRGYSGLVDWLKENFGLWNPTPGSAGNLVEFGYDWRLSNRNSARRLRATVEHELLRWRNEGHPDAEVVFLCHSMGGLVARYYLEVLGGAEVARTLVTFGTPHRGAGDAVLKLVNGVKVGKGPIKVDVSALGRSLPSTYQLLPTYACVNTPTGRVDLATAALPRLDPARVADAAAFHAEIANGSGGDYGFRMVVGTRQPTWTTVDVDGDRVIGLRTIDGKDERGDGTVPRFASIPGSVQPDDLRQLSSAQTHGWVHLHQSVLDDLHGILTARRVVYMDDGQPSSLEVQPSLDVAELSPEGEPIAVSADSARDDLLLWAALHDDEGHEVERVLMTNDDGGRYSAALRPTGPGIHLVSVQGNPGSGIDQVTTAVTVADVELD